MTPDFLPDISREFLTRMIGGRSIEKVSVVTEVASLSIAFERRTACQPWVGGPGSTTGGPIFDPIIRALRT